MSYIIYLTSSFFMKNYFFIIDDRPQQSGHCVELVKRNENIDIEYKSFLYMNLRD